MFTIRIKAVQLVCCLFLFFIFAFANAQSGIQSDIDSLEKVLPSLSAENKPKAELELIRNYQVAGKYSIALDLIEKCLRSAESRNDQKTIADATCFKGMILYYSSKYELSIRTLDTAFIIAEKNKYTSGMAKALCNRAKSMAALNEYDKALSTLRRSDQLARSVNDTAGIANVYYVKGSIYSDKGMYKLAITNLDSSLVLRNQINDQLGIAASLSFMGLNHAFLGDYPIAVEYLQKSIAIREKLGDKRGLANSYLNLYKVYFEIDDLEKALALEFKSLAICSDIGDQQCVSGRLTNIGFIYQKLGKYTEALEYHYKALAISKKINIRNRIALVLENIAMVNILSGKAKEALPFLDESAAIRKEIGDKEGVANCKLTYSRAYQSMNDHTKAIRLAEDALEDATKMQTPAIAANAHDLLSSSYSKVENFEKAFFHYNQFIVLRDSLYSKEKSKEITRKEMQFAFDKEQQIQQLQQEKKTAEVKQNAEKERFIRNILLIAIALFIFFTIIIIKAYVQKNKINTKLNEQKNVLENRNKEIHRQHEIIEVKNKEITDSIYYAQNIQSALMPSASDYNNFFEESLIVFKPKDIISGDFYWITSVDGKIIFATADCTGHGVPGGFMSMLGIALLNELVNDHGITEPSLVLSKLRKKVINALKQNTSVSTAKDGMDIVLGSVDKEKMILTYSAANNPLWIIRNGEGEFPALLEFKADKIPVGISGTTTKPFSQHNIPLLKGDIIYTFTDGYADQFGGEKGKKFKYKQLKELLLDCSSKPLSEQKIIIESTLGNWKGNLEQVDDILLIAVKV
ncbi:MAG: tetratricopeptide repeat protein [Bacteroidota bacterium]|nr:tetratricopeptide repeat protein [Bacteroidota bacterium]